MKKRLLIIVSIITLSLITFAGGVYANELYQKWAGTDNKNNMLETFVEIKENIVELKADKDSNKQVANGLKQDINDLKQTIKDKEQIVKNKEQLIKDKQKEVQDKIKEVADKQKEIDELKKNQTDNSNQLKQAEIDIKMLDKEADKLLEASEG